jgi:NADH dehydrogenase FAD-containing subunit
VTDVLQHMLPGGQVIMQDHIWPSVSSFAGLVRVLLGEVTGVDTALRQIAIGETRLAYDFLIIGTGARHSYFGHDDWAAAAPGLKGIEDALDIRRRLLLAFEAAESSQNEAERRAWLTFIIVGGGPTGVELTGAIAELAWHGLTREFRMFDPATMMDARVLRRAEELGIRSVPAVAIDGKLASCCTGKGVDLQVLEHELGK